MLPLCLRTFDGATGRRSMLALGSVLPFAWLLACGPNESTPPAEDMPLSACGPAIAGLARQPIVVEVTAEGGQRATLCLPRHEGEPADPRGSLSFVEPPSGLSSLQVMPLTRTLRLRLAQPVGPRGLDVSLTLDAPFRMISPDDLARFQRHAVVVGRFGQAPTSYLPVENLSFGPSLRSAQVRFHLPGHGIAPLAAPGELGDVVTLTLALPMAATQPASTPRYSYRAIGGVSMGGIGSSMQFFRRPDWFDAVGVMGADPGPDLTYAQNFIHEFFFGGFCEDNDPNCPNSRAPLAGQGEITGTFDAMPIQRGEGIGLTLRRSLYLRANRDLVRALGNWAYYNPADPYLPPGVPASTLSQTPEAACQSPVVLAGKDRDPTAKPFYDGRFNREGSHDVITFCDGGEVDSQPGVYDPQKTQRDPTQILLAVDVNGNGRRDFGEPVLVQSTEPFRDVGIDGIPSTMEPGYDPVKNPDPAGDDYHYLKNPGGTESNFRFDRGEPYTDSGLDGVTGSGCEIDTGTPGCFDHGEGNGRFDVSPGLARWLAHDPRSLMTPDALSPPHGKFAGKALYYDAGIRDFFNAHVATSALFGELANLRHSVRLFAGFPALVGRAPADEPRFDAASVPWANQGSYVFVRYGNPELSDSEAAASGDGRHAGSVAQVVHRAVSLFGFLLSRWPDGDTSLQSADDPRLLPKPQMFVQKNGRSTPYSIVLPPGYFDAANASVRYPVIYFGHGYGMAPEDLGRQIGSLIHGFMSNPDSARRLPKAVLVFLDGVCRPGGEVPRAPLDPMGDLCEEGGFYTDHPLGTYKGEQMLIELDAALRKQYRLKEPQ
ncbi:MAG: hypothetical protein JNJ46_09655 [Myxococcales bacterium]|nr:hypothetical protein [Myxococcales bacterium]